MICLRCSTDNETIRKYCKFCGAPMGIICDRCGIVNHFEDRYCGTCGLVLAGAIKSEAAPEPSAAQSESSQQSQTLIAPHTSTRQYSARDIEELLSLRRLLKEKEPTAKILNQNDIDDLFK